MTNPEDHDSLDWDRDRDGLVAEFAVEPEDEILTLPFEED